ncbi:MAG: hypothetical protein ACOH10_12645, partial [Rhodoglobus sp.]
MAREFARINIAIWQDDDWRALPPEAQHLYLTLWIHPKLSYAGVVDWRPGRIAAMAGGWTKDDVTRAADCLEHRLFIVRDDETEECLIRSFVRFDGLLKQPRMAVSFASAYAEVTSSVIRGVIIHEAVKLHEKDPTLAGWAKPDVQSMLALAVLDPRVRALPSDPFGDGFAHGFGQRLGETLLKVSVPPTPAPSPAPTPLLPDVHDETSSSGSKPKSRRKPSTSIPDGWAPSEKHREQAKALGIDVDFQAEKFRNWSLSKDARYANWDAAFRNWLTN